MTLPKEDEKRRDAVTPETDSDSWERFERAVDAAVKSGPKHKKREPEGSRRGSNEKADKPNDRPKAGR
jgi:hypothetical protein